MAWIGWTLGMSGPTVQAAKRKLKARYSYAKHLDDTEYFDEALRDVLRIYKPKRSAEGWNLRTDGVYLDVLDYQTQDSLGMISKVKPIMFTVEGHLSDMFAGPVADTANQLEKEGLVRHQPVGYNNGALPFDNASGVKELARLVGSTKLDNGTPFPAGTPWALGGFSQGGIIISYFYFDYLAPGKPLNWRLKDLKGVLAYGNPCRQINSIAPWCQSWATKPNTHGLDPYRRFGMPGKPSQPDNWMEVYRGGDIFAENTDDKSGEIKAAIYQAVMKDFFSNPFSLAAQIADLFLTPLEEVIGIVMAIISGVSFLAGQPNAHYSPFDLQGGVDWMRKQLKN
ncbi:MAG: hypothetical protein A4E20_10940 [Nitrospira sp. SG-bin2]|uniref:hypothetical protein n=1 Tax=Nitrospira cf. moscoviensis SBR1015 TaxID=96242 RepID=UPI000A0EA83F|nr:hypothetical protein [Nitrospira cf. moscoviensis SBR1015]OQW34528.1 MAG: hypothetical protein A4E20_10940 [Nitrospira sp. SG-bin2]